MKLERDLPDPVQLVASGLADTSILTERIVTLERRLRRVSTLAVGLVIVSGALSGLALHRAQSLGDRAREGVVEARRFVLTDAAGKERAVLAVQANGAASLYLTDTAAKPRATFGVGADGVPAIGLGDKNGTLRAAIAVGADGNTSLGFFDVQQRVRARFGLTPDEVPALVVFDDQGTPIGKLP
jgi:hypothetical protein